MTCGPPFDPDQRAGLHHASLWVLFGSIMGLLLVIWAIPADNTRTYSTPGAAPRRLSYRSRQPSATGGGDRVLPAPFAGGVLRPLLPAAPFGPPSSHATGPSAVDRLAEVLDGPTDNTAFPPAPRDSGSQRLLGAMGLLLVPALHRLFALWRGQGEEVRWAMTSLAAAASADGSDKAAASWTLRASNAWSLIKPDFLLLAYLAVWYFGNYKSNISNKLALAEMGGAMGCPLLVGSAEMLVGVLYALFLWAAPDARPWPQITRGDVMALVPLTICTLGHQFSTVYATSAGSLSSVQILKATEPVFAALFASFIYGTTVSQGKWLSLIPIIGGVSLASVKEISFSWVACAAVFASNVFSAMRSNESRKAMRAVGLKDRLGSVGNQFAVTTCLCFLMGLPISLLMEWRMLPTFCRAMVANPIILAHIVSAGLWFYIYNEVSTLVVKRTGALTQSVLNTAKRVIVIVGASLVLGEGLAPLKLVGCTIGIVGVFLYSIADKLKKPKTPPPIPEPPVLPVSD